MLLSTRFFTLAISLSCVILVNAQASERSLPDSLIRQRFAVKYNIGLLMLPVGAEAQLDFAAHRNIHITTALALCVKTRELVVGEKIKNEYAHCSFELRYFYPKKYSFNGLFAGAFYTWRMGQYFFNDSDPNSTTLRYNWNANSFGIIGGFSLVTKRHPKFILELYGGYGYSPYVHCVRGNLSNPDPDLEERINYVKSEETFFLRGGISIGFAQ